MNELDALFAEINSYPLTVKIPTKFSGKKIRAVNELPLISQSVANAISTIAWGLASPRGKVNLQTTLEISIKRKFLPYINAIARGNKSLHHVYEWNKAGITSARLFDLVIPKTSRAQSNFSMKVEFRPSKTLVPLTEAQATPNKVTGAVVKKKHIFYNKAMTMEYGETVTIKPLGDKKMAFDNPNTQNELASLSGLTGVEWAKKTMSGLTFTSKPITIDYSRRPTYHGFQNALSAFFNSIGKTEINDSSNRYARAVSRGASKSSHMISVSVPSDAYAHAVAEKITNSLVVV
jgi:hypothetical protein